MDTYTRIIGKTVEELRDEARPVAEQSVRRDLVLDAVAESEQVTVPDPEVEQQVQLVAGSSTLSTKERRRLLASDDLRQRIRRRLRRQYAISRLLELISPPEQESAPAVGTVDAVAETAAAETTSTTLTAGAAETAAVVEDAAPSAAVDSSEPETPSVQQNEQES